MDEKEQKQEISLPKEEKPEGGIKKVAENLKQFAKKPNPSANYTSRDAFLKRLNAEKDPKKRAMIKAALKGRLFQ